MIFFILDTQTFPTIRIFKFCSQALSERWQFLYWVHKHSRKWHFLNIWFTSAPENMTIFIFGSQALPKAWQFFIWFISTLGNMAGLYSDHKHSRKHGNFYIRLKSTPGNMTIFIFRFHALPETLTFVYIRCKTLPKTK